MSVHIITDSTADMTPEWAQLLGVTVTPLNVHFGTDVFLDGETLHADEFYERLVASDDLPKTSQPSVGAFLEQYKRAAVDAHAIASIHISSKLSGTYNSAVQAREQADGLVNVPIEVVDSRTATAGLALVVRAAAGAAQRGADLQGVLETTRDAMTRVHFFGVLDTLEYLQKGGRIGRAQAFLGSMLNVKPILEVRDGEVLPLARTRARRKAIDMLCQLVSGLAPVEEIVVVHCTTPDDADALAQRLHRVVPDVKIDIGRIGPVVGTYVGPGGLGVGLLQKG